MSKPHVTIKSFSPAYVGKSFSQSLGAIGGDPPYSWTATGLPPGLKVNFDIVEGTPTKKGTYSVTLKVTDMAKQTATATLTLTVVNPLVLTTSSLPNAVPGQAYSYQLSATGGTLPYTFSIATGQLPTGITLSPSGLISGTTQVGGAFTATFEVQDNS